MFHSNTERLIDYWRTRKSGGESPPRSAIDPIALSSQLPQIFILGRLAPGKHVIRLAGGLICDLHQRDLRQADFLDLWSPVDRLALASALESARRAAEPIVVTAETRAANGGAAVIEVMLAPIHAGEGEPVRTLGLYQPVSPLARLGGLAIGEMTVRALTRGDGGSAAPALRLAAVDGRRVA